VVELRELLLLLEPEEPLPRFELPLPLPPELRPPPLRRLEPELLAGVLLPLDRVLDELLDEPPLRPEPLLPLECEPLSLRERCPCTRVVNKTSSPNARHNDKPTVVVFSIGKSLCMFSVSLCAPVIHASEKGKDWRLSVANCTTKSRPATA